MKLTKTNFKLISLALCAAMLLPLCACGEESADASVTAMGAAFTVTAYGKGREKAASDAAGVITAIGDMLDNDNTESAVYALNHADGQSVVVPSQLVDIDTEAKTVYEQTHGALDLTIYPVLKLWGFGGNTGGELYVPTKGEIKEQLEKLNFDGITTQDFPDSGTVTMTLPTGSEITFNAGSQGCAADGAANALQVDGVSSGIISAPGCVETVGAKPDGSQWNIAVEDPDDPSRSLGYITAGETAICTSGSYRYSLKDDDGNTYGHIFDPDTGKPVISDLKSVTVICTSGIRADLLSTALFVIGKKDALTYWRRYGDFQMILVTDTNQVLCTSGLTEAFTLNDSAYTVSFTE